MGAIIDRRRRARIRGQQRVPAPEIVVPTINIACGETESRSPGRCHTGRRGGMTCVGKHLADGRNSEANQWRRRESVMEEEHVRRRQRSPSVGARDDEAAA